MVIMRAYLSGRPPLASTSLLVALVLSNDAIGVVNSETRMEACSANITMPASFGPPPSAAQHPKAQGSRPNILFVLSDQQRYDFDGAHPEIALEQPHLQRLAREGVRFTAAFSPSPLCGPSRSCMAVGRQYHETLPHLSSEGFNGGPPPKFETFYTRLQRSGYHTMTCGKDDLQKGNAQKAGRDRRSDAASLTRLGFSDFERSLGKKNVFALKTKAADQYGDFLLRLGNTPPLLQLQAEALQAGSSDPQPGSDVDAEALSPPSSSGNKVTGESGTENRESAQDSGVETRAEEKGASLDGDNDLFLEGSRSRALKAKRPVRSKAGSSSGSGQGHLRNRPHNMGSNENDNSSSSSSVLHAHDSKAPAIAAADDGSGELVGRAYARHWASGFPAGGGFPHLGQRPGAGLQVVDAAYKQCHPSGGGGNSVYACPPFPASFPDEAQEDSFVGRQALRLLRRRPKEKPFFLQVNFPSPHDPYTITQCMAQAIRGSRSKVGNPDGSARRGYAALCEHVDVWLGRFLDELAAEPAAAQGADPSEQRSAADTSVNVPDAASNASSAVDAGLNSSAPTVPFDEQNRRINRPFTPEAVEAAREVARSVTRSVLDVTLVCFSSDHGDMLGDGNKWGKQVPGQGSIAVPLVCRGPTGLTLGGSSSSGGGVGADNTATTSSTSSSTSSSSSVLHWPPARVKRGMVVQQPVSIADLGPTFLDVAGVTKPATMTGRSLLPVLLGYATPHQVRRVVTSALKDWRVAVASVRVAPPNPGFAAANVAAAAAKTSLAVNGSSTGSSSTGTVTLGEQLDGAMLVSRGTAPELVQQVGRPAVAGLDIAGSAGNDGSLWINMVSSFNRNGPAPADGSSGGSWKLVHPTSNHVLPIHKSLSVSGLVEAVKGAYHLS